MGYDPDELNDEADDAPEPEDVAVIEEIEETTAGNVFPPEVDLDDPAKPMIEVTAVTQDDSETPVTETFSLPQSDRAWHNPQFQLGQFRDYYGSVPEVGQEVEVAMNDDGLLQIVYSDDSE